MVIIKRSGEQEAFDPDKVKSAIAATSDEARQPLNASDLNAIAGDLQKMLEGKESATSRQIYVMVAGILLTMGLQKIAQVYVSSAKNAWHL